MYKSFAKFTLAALVLGGLTAAARADIYQTYDIAYSGASFSNPATASGTITLDLTAFGPDSTDVTGSFLDSFSTFVSSFNLTVSGSTTGGNGTFTQADYYGFIASLNGVDLTTQVVGQGGLYDFNIFSDDSAPYGVDPLTIADAGGDGLALTSLVPVAAPEPGQMVAGLAIAGLGGANLLVRRMRNRK